MKEPLVLGALQVFAVTAVLCVLVSGKKDEDLFCAACRALVNEVTVIVEKIDQNKKIKVGSFRVDSKGNQRLEEVKYARSKLHLAEVFESVCVTMRDYVVTLDDDGTRSVARKRDPSGAPLSLKNIKFSSDRGALLQFYCDTLIEDYEDELISFFSEENDSSTEKVVCIDTTGACTEEQLSRPLPQLPQQEKVEEEADVGEKGEDVEDDDNEDDDDKDASQAARSQDEADSLKMEL